MEYLKQLITQVEEARHKFLRVTQKLNLEQANYQPHVKSWSVIENLEHIVLAEQIGINRIWKASDALRKGQPIWEGTPVHHGLNIDQIIAKTWKAKERVPEVAKPRWGGPLTYWRTALESNQLLLKQLSLQLQDQDLEKIIYPHPISGPMNGIQRLQFLRFHLDRHRAQIESIKGHSDFPV